MSGWSPHPEPALSLVLDGFLHAVVQEAEEVITRERFDGVQGLGSSSDGDGIK